MTIDEIGEQLTEWGKVVRLTTLGRVSGRDLAVVLGFVRDPEGNVLVAAGDPDADWALNLAADPRCTVTVGGDTWRAIAEPLDRVASAVAVRALILRYGTPAERLGRGPAFRLVPVAAA